MFISPQQTLILFRLHWRVRGGRRPPQRQDRHPAQRPHQQDRCHLSPLQRPAPRHGEVGRQATSLASIRLHRPDHLRWYHGPRGGPQEARCWQDSRFLLLEAVSICGGVGFNIPWLGQAYVWPSKPIMGTLDEEMTKVHDWEIYMSAVMLVNVG